jgi:hypothetical protein
MREVLQKKRDGDVWRGMYAMRDGAAMPKITHRLLGLHRLRHNHVQAGKSEICLQITDKFFGVQSREIAAVGSTSHKHERYQLKIGI